MASFDDRVWELSRTNGNLLSRRECATALEVIDQYDGVDPQAALALILDRWRDTSRPFRVYDAAHAACARLSR